MTAESIRIERDALLTRIVASTASATRVLKAMIRDLRRSQWFLLVAVVGGAVIALVAIKLMALLAAAFDISFLRDVGNNVGSGGAAGGGGAGAGGAAGDSGGLPPPVPAPVPTPTATPSAGGGGSGAGSGASGGWNWSSFWSPGPGNFSWRESDKCTGDHDGPVHWTRPPGPG